VPVAWNLKQRRLSLKLRVPEEDAELLAHQAVADVLVAVAVRAERRLRVVHVQAAQALDADVPAELPEQVVERGRLGDVVAGREQVARIEADAEPLVAVDRLVDRRKLLQ
jgi:hypothetical protein